MLSPKYQRFFQVAEAVAASSNHPQFKIGAVVVVKQRVVAVGANNTRSHPLQKQYNLHRFDDDSCKHTTHAELNALMRAERIVDDLSFAKIFVFRTLKNGAFGNARPCAGCMAAIKDFGIRHVNYTTNDGFASETIAKGNRS